MSRGRRGEGTSHSLTADSKKPRFLILFQSLNNYKTTLQDGEYKLIVYLFRKTETKSLVDMEFRAVKKNFPCRQPAAACSESGGDFT